MHFSETKSKAPFFIKAYEDGQLFINDEVHIEPIIIFQDQLKKDLLPKTIEELTSAHIEQIIGFEPELILIGTGEHQKFLEHTLIAPFSKKKIGIEVMSTLSAARTFNLLREEGRKVLGIFFL